MGNLAETLRAVGDLAGARSLQEAALETERRILGDEHPGTLTSISNLALTLSALGDLAGARSFQEAVLEDRRRILGDEHPDTLRSIGNLASTLRALGDLAGGRSLQEAALEARRRILGERHPDATISAWNLVLTLLDQGDQEEAGGIFVRDLAWLQEAEADDLGAKQRTIRGYLAEMAAGSDSGEEKQDPAGRGDEEGG
jgi:tetratricopeptide (TPR) repeat protein